MDTTTRYALGHTPQEYERLRGQARVWEDATGRLLDRVGLAPQARCLDAGCGPGETMRLMAHRVGPAGEVIGIDVDAGLGALTEAMLHNAGHSQCRFQSYDLTTDAPVPGEPYDLVFARLLLFHLPHRAAVLARLWDAVAPGGSLVVQDYYLPSVAALPELPSLDAAMRLLCSGFAAVGADVAVGARLPALFAEAGIGAPDGTDVAGRLTTTLDAATYLGQTVRSVLPVIVARGVATEADALATLESLDADAAEHADSPALWPLMIGAWKRKA
jgi:ubiquinone/menaquinone biosynthesis C-methylase UbiE